ncbi:hypothetical protein MYK68_07865 [Gordonia sp. PP30]|uniref:hypothetical protein n=1 Tax=Gordonia sp. PP30 TaxID=2935861 RepID=UPI001FFF30FC|nr:hypothetical protein [Gordonia sp. PP30]UQE76473.1 hypothetical protein MYK68_07865 [Gordonia sp. PP30]
MTLTAGTETGDQLTEWGARLDQAIANIAELPDEQRAVAQDFALALDALSRSALTTMVRRLRADERGKELLFELVDDPSVRFLLGMHGIIRLPDPAQSASATATPPTADPAAPTTAGTFFSLESLLRPRQSAGHACGCSGGGSCACGTAG